MTRNQKSSNAVREVLTYSNIEITANRLRFSKLIKAFEQINWADAQKKAAELIKSNQAHVYIDSIRDEFNPKESKVNDQLQNEKKVVEQIKSEKRTEPTLEVVPDILTDTDLPSENFKLLYQLVPDIGTEILTHPEYYAIASKLASPDFSFEPLEKGENGFYALLVSYHEDIKAADEHFRMKLFVDLESEKIFPIFFKDVKGKRMVYHEENIHGFVLEKERDSQNDFLNTLLRKLVDEAFTFEQSEHLIKKEEREKAIKEKEELAQHWTMIQNLRAQQERKQAEQKRKSERLSKLIFEEKKENNQEQIKETFKVDECLTLHYQLQGELNANIPDFPVGQVEFTKTHERLGLTTKDIERLNKKQQGFLAIINFQLLQNHSDKYPHHLTQAPKRFGIEVTNRGKINITGVPFKSDDPECLKEAFEPLTDFKADVLIRMENWSHSVLLNKLNLTIDRLHASLFDRILEFDIRYLREINSGNDLDKNTLVSLSFDSKRIKRQIQTDQKELIERYKAEQAKKENENSYAGLGILAGVLVLVGAAIGIKGLE